MDFLILRPLSPETGYHFFEGGGLRGGGGVQNFVLRRVQAVGRASAVPCSGPMVVQPTADLEVGGSIPSWPTVVGAAIGRLGFEPPTCRFAVGCSTTRPLCVLHQVFSQLLEAKPATEKKPKLCVSVCLPACPTDCLTDCWPD